MTPEDRATQEATGQASDGRTSVVEAVLRLQIERDEAVERLVGSQQREQDIARRFYRRGYLAGRAAQRRGAPTVTNPERNGRRETREMLA